MIEMALLQPSKETDNKLRWSAYIEADKTEFHLYIPKWRVPEPWPWRLLVEIKPLTEYTELRGDIRSVVRFNTDHTRTSRYTPVGKHEDWEIGEPYIPHSLVPDQASLLLIDVHWDTSTKGEFFCDCPSYGGTR